MKTKKDATWIPLNLGEMFLTSAERYPESEVLRYRVGHHYESLTYSKLKIEVIKLAMAFESMGFVAGDRALILSENRPEWVITDLAVQVLGGTTVPVHEVLSPKQLAGIIKEIKPKVLLYSVKEIEDKLLEISGELGKVEHLVSYSKIDSGGFVRVKYFKDLVDSITLSEGDESRLITGALAVSPKAVASIIYTSGTTGHLKGVQLTHENFVQDIVGTTKAIWILPTDKFFSVLPLSHVFERTAGYYIPLYAGASIGYNLSLENLTQEIAEFKPTIVLAVPRLFEKIYEKVMAKAKASPVTKLIFKLAFSTKKKSPFYPIFDKLVFSKVKEIFGGNIRFFVSGGASLPVKIGRFFEKLDMLVIEGYGLTETSPIVAVNQLSKYRFGTVGDPIYNVKVKFTKEGEILVKGPTITKGYLRTDDNKGAFTSDGYFKTGDLGYLDSEGFLTISGRKKDLIVLTTGKKVAPVPIETALETSEYIDQAFVTGDGRKHVSALIVPNYDKLSEHFGVTGKVKLSKMPEVLELVSAEALEKTHRLSSIERIRKFRLLTEPFSIAGGEFTPKLSLKRQVVLEKYGKLIEDIYA